MDTDLINKSMVKHLERKVSFENKLLNKESIVLDIGSNDGTTLNSYNSNCIKMEWIQALKNLRNTITQE